ncbi:DUF4126 domain-containing protein [Janibacter indicus]|uniref:DUF4126 domain-containing protein n=1 Tax=Janibacter indicus TaxID=857417 RepID=A0A1L3MIG7_9MICO|nr:DUF4126 domain-containing protein [Janibacter indicus]APH02227.1 hypothetical protein ASJ30_12385 [Janibacter indicus]QOK22166.1 DUF4126 domain-containing protein [Janibacter indicus]
MIAALTGMGLSAAAGLNAYIPFIIVALLARFTDAVVLPTGFEWMESWWAIGIGAVLLVTEITLDKVPAVDSLNDAVQTVIRPGMGGLMGAATAGASTLDESTWMQEHAWVGVVLGIVVAGLVHTGKAASRPVINAGTAGFGAPVASTAEDGVAVGIALVAIFLPLLVILVLVVLVAALVWVLSAWRRLRRRRQARLAA